MQLLKQFKMPAYILQTDTQNQHKTTMQSVQSRNTRTHSAA